MKLLAILKSFYLIHCKLYAIVLLFTRKSTAITLAKTILIFPVKARFLFNQNSINPNSYFALIKFSPKLI